MEDYDAMIRNTFELGSVRYAEALFDACVENAFPTSHFRRLELIRFVKDEQYLEGRSWNHVFDIWKVHCHRVTMGETPDKTVCLDYMTLGFVAYLYPTEK